MEIEYIIFSSVLIIAGAVVVHFTNRNSYDRGIMDAVQMHREGRLHYNTYLDDNGDKMLNIEIDPMEDE
jgi:hypothetical protein|tara:strand:+ start:1700 stop:1906 length:207 start_codon:yes stop_codon:yes gene_type:complete